MTQEPIGIAEPTPVDDVRRVRERFDREAGGNMHALAEQSRAAVERYRAELNLKVVAAPAREPRREGKTA